MSIRGEMAKMNLFLGLIPFDRRLFCSWCSFPGPVCGSHRLREAGELWDQSACGPSGGGHRKKRVGYVESELYRTYIAPCFNRDKSRSYFNPSQIHEIVSLQHFAQHYFSVKCSRFDISKIICAPLRILLLLGWWFVSSEDAQGWVPATCLEAQTQDDPDEFTFPGGEGELPLFQ